MTSEKRIMGMTDVELDTMLERLSRDHLIQLRVVVDGLLDGLIESSDVAGVNIWESGSTQMSYLAASVNDRRSGAA